MSRCNKDCEHCTRPVSQCHGGDYHTPYINNPKKKHKPKITGFVMTPVNSGNRKKGRK